MVLTLQLMGRLAFGFAGLRVDLELDVVDDTLAKEAVYMGGGNVEALFVECECRGLHICISVFSGAPGQRNNDSR